VTALHHVEFGVGTPLLALHGWTVDHRLMTGCLEPLFVTRPGYRRVYPDLPGMGKSPAESIASGDDLLAAVLDFVDEVIGGGRFLLVGESYGGYLARGIAAARPGRVLGLGLICPTGPIEPTERTVPPKTVLRPDVDLIAALDPIEAEEYTDVAVVQSPSTLRRFREEVAPGLSRYDRVAIDRIEPRRRLSVAPEDDEPLFASPALILTGRQDDTVGYVDQFALLPHYPRATFAVLDVAGHNLQIEQPDLFEALVAEWLDRVAAEGGH
jgi:pimeloyl-ACP methyl ester carboxylesterase